MLATTAQTAVWQLRPTDYNEITLINTNLYKVQSNGKIGLIHADGTVVAPATNDNISDYYEGKALVTVNDGNGERVAGCLTESGKFFPYSAKYYTLSGQKFFSDGALSVADEQGKLGYIDEAGAQICGFDGKYDKIKPFNEGYAAVFKNKKYSLINKYGEPVHFTFASVGEVASGTNVSNGYAYVWDSDGRFFTYNVDTGGNCKKARKPQNTNLDYLYCFSSITGKSKDVPFRRGSYRGAAGAAPTADGGMYGYKSGERTVLPAQFSAADQFEDGYAPVVLNGRLGILKWIDGAVFALSEVAREKRFYAGKAFTCQFVLDVPEVWRDADLNVEVKDENGVIVDSQKEGNSYAFSQTLSASCAKTYSVTVSGDGLKLFEGALSYEFKKIEVCSTCGRDKDKCPGHPKCPVCGKEKSKCPGHTSTAEVCPGCGKEINKAAGHCRTCHKTLKECKYQGVH